MAAQLAPFKEKAEELLKTELSLLEVASTIVYFRQQGVLWPVSVEDNPHLRSWHQTQR